MALATKSKWQLFVFGGTASCCGEICTVPLDVVKVRLQLQGTGVPRASFSGIFSSIVREEGFPSLWKGVQPALLRQLTYGGMRLGMYEPIKSGLLSLSGGSNAPGADFPLYIKMGSGCLSGYIASGLFNPMDVLKVRMQADTTGKLYRGLIHGFSTIARTEGLRGLYKGVHPTTQRAAIVAAVEISSYDELKVRLTSILGEGLATHFTAAIAAGFLCTVASSPTDVIKSRLMSQPVDANGRGLAYSGTIDCFKKTVAGEGAASLFKGFWPSFGRIGPHCVITYMALEQLRGLAARFEL